MNVTVTSEHRFLRAPDGSVWTETAHPYSFWARYLSTFSRVKVVARTLDVREPPAGARRADGDAVVFGRIPYYVGPREYLAKRRAVVRAVCESVTADEAVILRVSSHLASCLQPELRRRRQPYGVEVISDPWDTFSPNANPHPLRPVLRRWCYTQLRRQCNQAVAAAYVTEHALQQRYPCSAYSVGVSDVELRSIDYVADPRTWSAPLQKQSIHNGSSGSPLVVITVATMAALYKGNDLLIKAIAICRQNGLDVRLKLIGDGKFRNSLEALANSLHVSDCTTFMGHLPSGTAILQELDKADLFVLASRQEGLPRAMVEAMARALPCIGSEIGGIPELISAEDIVPTNNAAALARKIAEALTDSARLERMSIRNLKRARDFEQSRLGPKQQEFFDHVKNVTDRWTHDR